MNLVVILILCLAACASQPKQSNDSKMIITLNKVGQAAERAQRYEYAVSVYKEAHKLQPDNIEIIQHLVKNLSSLQQYHKVSSICQIGLKLDPDNVSLIETLSTSLIAQGMWSNAAYWVQRDLELTKGYSVLGLNSLSLILDSLNNHKKAQRCYKKSFDLDNQNQQTLNNYGLSLALSNKIEKAIDYLLAANSLTDSRVSLANINLIKKLRKKHRRVGKRLQNILFPHHNYISKASLKNIYYLYKSYCVA